MKAKKVLIPVIQFALLKSGLSFPGDPGQDYLQPQELQAATVGTQVKS